MTKIQGALWGLLCVGSLAGCVAEAGELGAGEEVRSAVVSLDLDPAEFAGRELSLHWLRPGDDGVVDEYSIPLRGTITPELRLAFEVDAPLAPDTTYHVMAVPRTPGEEPLRVTTFLTDRSDSTTAVGGKADGRGRFAVPIRNLDRVVVDTLPPPVTGNFNLASSAPEHLATGVPRDVDFVLATFADEAIDCGATLTGLTAFALYSEAPGVRNHLFRRHTIVDPSHHDYRGHFECDAARNQLVFYMPGYLHGNAWYRMSLPVVSTEGSRRTFTLRFKTENPGLKVDVNVVESHKDECADDTWRWWNDEVKRCDVYLMTSVTLESQRSAVQAKLPDPAGEATWSNIVRNTPTIVATPTIFSDGSPVGRALRIDVVGMDKDDDSARSNLQAFGGVLTALGPWLPAAGVVGGVVIAGVSFIPVNDNDLLATMQIHLTDNVQRWGTTDYAPLSQPLANYGRKYTSPNGNLSLWLHTEEWPRTWQPQPILL